MSMKILVSRHAKRRMKLYGLSEDTVLPYIQKTILAEGANELLFELPGTKYPVKVVVAVEGGIATIITSYPLKRGREK